MKNSILPPNQTLLAPKYFAYLIGVSYKTILNLIYSGEIVAHRFGRHYKIYREDAEDFINRSKVAVKGNRLKKIQPEKDSLPKYSVN